MLPENDLGYGERRCPACRSKTTERLANGIRVDACRSCKGAWFSANELQKALEMELENISSTNQCHRLCPECARLMQTVLVEDENVEIDQCPQCQGIWLDAGEFRRLNDFEPPNKKAARRSSTDTPTGLKKMLLNMIDSAFASLNNWS